MLTLGGSSSGVFGEEGGLGSCGWSEEVVRDVEPMVVALPLPSSTAKAALETVVEL